MSTYAILGTTGSTGGSILEILTQKPENKVHAFVRSAAKLKGQWPQLAQSRQLRIFEGQLSDTEALANCLESTKAAFLCIAAVMNEPYCTIAQDEAKAVIAACELLRSKSPQRKLPKLIQLNSSSTDEKFSESLPKIAHFILYRGNYWIYEDLKAARQMLLDQSWLDCTFIMPGGLIKAPQTGHKLSTERQQTFLGWLDLAAGMVEVADEDSGVWKGKNVSVVPTSDNVPFDWIVPFYILPGLLLTYFPWIWGPAKQLGIL